MTIEKKMIVQPSNEYTNVLANSLSLRKSFLFYPEVRVDKNENAKSSGCNGSANSN